MQSKLQRLVDKWFEGCGFETIGRITGITNFQVDDIDSIMQEAMAIWNQFHLCHKVSLYRMYGFDDHQYFNEKEFLNAITKEL